MIDRPLKIALLSRWLWEENRRLDGQGMAQQLAEAVAAQGHEVVVLSQSPQVTSLQRAAPLGPLETWLSPREKRRPGWIGLRDKIAKQAYGHRKVHSDALDLGDFLFQRGPFDLLWAQTEEPDGLVAAVAAQRGIPLPPIFLQVQALRTRFRPGQTHFTHQQVLSFAFERATRIISNSPLISEKIFAHYQRSSGIDLRQKTGVIFPNLTQNFLQAASALSAHPVTPEKNRLLFLGALNESKGVLPFLAAIPLAQPPPHTTFALAGAFTENNPSFARRWHKAMQETRSKLSLHFPTVQIELLGKIPASQVIHEIGRSTAVVLPSRFEPFSRALAEALVLGRPAIITDQTGAAPLLFPNRADLPLSGAAGWIVPPENPRALAQAMQEALQPNSLQAANAKKRAVTLRQELSPETIATELIAVFRSIDKKE